MSNITWADKVDNAGDATGVVNASDMNNVKSAVNSKAEFPGSGIPNSTGSAWGTSYTLDTDLTSVSGSDDSLPSAKATRTALDLLKTKQPTTLSLTSDHTITEAEILANDFINNYGATGEVDIVLPAVSYNISRTIIVSAAYIIEINPPSGESLDFQGTTLTADYVIDSPAVAGSKCIITRRRTGASTWIWDIDVARGIFSNPGRVSD